jgi:hypothetical protein
MKHGMTGFRSFLSIAAFFVVSIGLADVAFADSQSDNNKTVARIGVQIGNSSAYFGVNEGLTLSCQYSLIYVDLSADAGKTAYSHLLAATLAGRKLTRIDYHNSGAGTLCSLDLVEFAS